MYTCIYICVCIYTYTCPCARVKGVHVRWGAAHGGGAAAVSPLVRDRLGFYAPDDPAV